MSMMWMAGGQGCGGGSGSSRRLGSVFRFVAAASGNRGRPGGPAPCCSSILGSAMRWCRGFPAGSGSVLESGSRQPHWVSRLILPTGAWEAGVTGSSVFARCSASPAVPTGPFLDPQGAGAHGLLAGDWRSLGYGGPEEACSPEASCPGSQDIGRRVQVLEKPCSARERPARRCRCLRGGRGPVVT
jgi:hypothetical protein